MNQREQQITKFLLNNNLTKAVREKLKSDASFRKYERLFLNQESLILMDAPVPKEDIRPFIKVANYLTKNGFSAPKIYAQDIENGFLILEDLGDNLYTSLLKNNFSEELEFSLYQEAINVLVKLRNTPIIDLPLYDKNLLLKEVQLLTDWYLPNVAGVELTDSLVAQYNDIWSKLLDKLMKEEEKVVVLRDYHADNLIWLKERELSDRVGLIDFQDGVIGSPIYDLISLIEDARRDISPNNTKKLINYYIEANNIKNLDQFNFLYSVIAAQRNCKIIGIFARLTVRDSKPRYLDYLPRVWRHLDNDLSHSDLKALDNWFKLVMDRKFRDKSYFKIVS